MKNKRKIRVWIFLILCCITTSVNAASKRAGDFHLSYANLDNAYVLDGNTERTFQYTATNSTNGLSTNKIWCLDPADSAPSSMRHCTYEILKPGDSDFADYAGVILAGNGNYVATQMALRIVNASKGTMHRGSTSKGKNYASAYYDYISGTDRFSGSNWEAAKSIYANRLGYSATATSMSSNLKFTKASETKNGDEHVITYNVTSSTVASTLAFKDITCSGGSCRIISSMWSGQSGTITIGVTPSKCGKANFSITTNEAGDGGMAIALMKCGSTNQQFVADLTGLVNQEATFSGTVEDDCNCDTMDPNDPDYPEECKNLCTEKTTIDWPGMCQEYGDELTGTITAPNKNILACIIEQEDDAGNAYQVSNIEGLDGNPYCTVSCKEDYQIGLPGAVNVNSGRYFSLKTRIAGQRDCYTNDIDVEKYISDMIAAQENMIAAMNESNKQKAYNESKANILETEEATLYDYQCDSLNHYQASIPGRKVTKYTGKKVEYDCYEIYEYEKDEYGNRNGVAKVRKKVCKVQAQWGEERIGGNPLSCIDDSSREVDDGITIGDTNYSQYKQAMEEYVFYLQSCSNWTNEFCMDPTITFEYEEPYNGGSIQFTGTGSDKGTTTEEVYCWRNPSVSKGNEVTESYECTTSTGRSEQSYSYATCDGTACTNTYVQTVSLKHRYIKKSAVNERTYTSPIEFYNKYPYGTITTSGGNNTTKLPSNSLPVALNSSQAAYTFSFTYEGVGMYNENASGCDLGRLIPYLNGSKPSVFDTQNKTGEYFCSYVVDCDECSFRCEGDWCEIIDPDPKKCETCEVYCSDCIFVGDIAFHVSIKSTNELFNSGETPGNNWTTDKGQATIEEIETEGDNILIEAQYSVTMTPANMAKAREYNKKVGSFNDDSLHCSEQNGVMICRSNFLDVGEQEGFFSNLVRNEEWRTWNGEAWS